MAALPAIVNVAVICVLLTTVVLLTVTPVPLTFALAPATKFVPISVTGTLVPAVPLDGLTELSVGAGGGFTVKVTLLLVPPLVITVTL